MKNELQIIFYSMMKMLMMSQALIQGIIYHQQLANNWDKAYYNLGLTAFNQGDYAKAVTAFKTATEINLKPYSYWQKLGQTYAKLKQYKKAIAAYQKAIFLSQSNICFDLELLKLKQLMTEQNRLVVK